MNGTDPARAFTDDLCLGCGYQRRGLAVDAACPECGAAPALDALALRGSSDTAPPWVAITVGAICAALLVFQIGLFVQRLATRGGLHVNFGAAWGTFLGLAFGLRGLRRWRMQERGGDILWLLGEQGLEVRVGQKQPQLALADLSRYKVVRKSGARYVRLTLRSKGSWSSLKVHRICAVKGDPAIDRMVGALANRGVMVA